MTEGFVTIGSNKPHVKVVAGWLDLHRNISKLRGYATFTDGSVKSFSGGLVDNQMPDDEIGKLILDMIVSQEKTL
jgi:hypothetical protein